MRYHGTVIRPPSEARSYILQVTFGCSHNRCTFCGTFQDKAFGLRPSPAVLADIQMASELAPHTRRVFLADGNALVLPTHRLAPILDALADAFPRLERVGIYANARDILTKDETELAHLRQKKLSIVYLGLESGSDEVLRRVCKGASTADMIAAVHKAKAAGIQVSVIGILGLGGLALSSNHTEATGRVVSTMDPDYFSMLTLMLVPGTKLHRQWQAGEFDLLGPKAMLSELRQVIDHLDGLTHCLFRSNHASNYLALGGTLPQDKKRLLATLEQGRLALRPESWRAL